ncbi:uncharacterized protein EV420DRAFT_1581526 [Desarmillaria tabescens]|uniref:F-box domain-containing protein n=1 Tax=Armillaria tabescens TaxID=1929756 RepID=A0AA39JDK6_ARMTA|nr:uncharacterized protein EV420DRAFT_1581526 [Desarmillaria tabescens]KAK0440663.1 hypothetical protein EV420DRAFT_1581526 [Desarmillaria tabescens]
MARLIVSQCHRWEVFMWEEASEKRPLQPSGDTRDMTMVQEDAPLCLQEVLPEEIWDGAEQELTRPRLRRFHTSGTVKSNPFRLLRSALNLSELSLVLALRIPSQILPLTPIMHTGIRLLDVVWNSFHIIDHLSLPQLKTLGIAPLNFSKVVAFLRRSGCTLETLRIRNPRPLDARSTQILDATPHLKNLSLRWTMETVPGANNFDNHVSILDKLVVQEDQPILLPLLESLSIEIDESFRPQTLVRMLKLRNRQNKCQLLRNVEIRRRDEDFSLAGVKSYMSAHGKELSNVQISYL